MQPQCLAELGGWLRSALAHIASLRMPGELDPRRCIVEAPGQDQGSSLPSALSSLDIEIWQNAIIRSNSSSQMTMVYLIEVSQSSGQVGRFRFRISAQLVSSLTSISLTLRAGTVTKRNDNGSHFMDVNNMKPSVAAGTYVREQHSNRSCSYT